MRPFRRQNGRIGIKDPDQPFLQKDLELMQVGQPKHIE
jgi:hypothetical protein